MIKLQAVWIMAGNGVILGPTRISQSLLVLVVALDCVILL